MSNSYLALEGFVPTFLIDEVNLSAHLELACCEVGFVFQNEMVLNKEGQYDGQH